MNLTFKVYVASVSACQRSQDMVDSTKGMLYYEHSPLLLTSPSMDVARDQAEVIALNHWKREDGWFMHSVSISVATEEVLGQIFGLAQQGQLVADNIAEREFFRFDENATTDFDNVISTDEH